MTKKKKKVSLVFKAYLHTHTLSLSLSLSPLSLSLSQSHTHKQKERSHHFSTANYINKACAGMAWNRVQQMLSDTLFVHEDRSWSGKHADSANILHRCWAERVKYVYSMPVQDVQPWLLQILQGRTLLSKLYTPVYKVQKQWTGPLSMRKWHQQNKVGHL